MWHPLFSLSMSSDQQKRCGRGDVDEDKGLFGYNWVLIQALIYVCANGGQMTVLRGEQNL